MAHPSTRIEVGARVMGAHAPELHGREHDDTYAAQARRPPGFAAYQQNTARTIPVIALTPTSRQDEAARRRTPREYQHPGPAARTGPPR